MGKDASMIATPPVRLVIITWFLACRKASCAAPRQWTKANKWPAKFSLFFATNAGISPMDFGSPILEIPTFPA
jgi:hypothetical protein